MEAVWELIWGILAAFGLFSLCCCAKEKLLRPLPDPSARVVIPGWGNGETLEQTVRAFRWLRGRGLLYCPVAILDVGLTEAGRTLAQRLTRRWPEIEVWRGEEAAARLKEIHSDI